MNRVKKYSKCFDWDIFGVPLVSMRSGEYWIIDGQHRIELLKLMGVEEVLCQIICGLSYEEEAEKFVKLNSERGSLTSNQKFHARVESKEELALKIVDILQQCGFYYAKTAGLKKDNYISAISCIENIYKSRGEEHLVRLLKILRESWFGVHSSLIRDLFMGISTFIAETRGVKDDILCKALEEQVPYNILLRAWVCAGSNGMTITTGSGSKQAHVAKAIRDIYNEKRKELKAS